MKTGNRHEGVILLFWIVRSLAIAALVSASSIFSGAGPRMMSGGFLILAAIPLAIGGAGLQALQVESPRFIGRWMAFSSIGVVVGLVVGVALGQAYGGGHTVHGEAWSFQSGIIGIAMGLFVGLGQMLSGVEGNRLRWPWIVTNIFVFGIGGGIVDQPFNASLALLISIAYGLTAIAVMLQSSPFLRSAS